MDATKVFCMNCWTPLADLVQGQHWGMILRMFPALLPLATCNVYKIVTQFPRRDCSATLSLGNAELLLILIFKLSKPHTSGAFRGSYLLCTND